MARDLLISSGSLFEKGGPLYNALFEPPFDFVKGCFNL